MSTTEFMYWMAYYNLEPWGSRIDGMRMAANTAGVYNAGLMQANPKKLKQKPCRPDDFYIGVDGVKKKGMSWQQHKSIMDALAKRTENERRRSCSPPKT